MKLFGGPKISTRCYLAIAQIDSEIVLDLVDTALGNLTRAHTFTPIYKKVDSVLADSIFSATATIFREAERVPRSSLVRRLRKRAEICGKLGMPESVRLFLLWPLELMKNN